MWNFFNYLSIFDKLILIEQTHYSILTVVKEKFYDVIHLNIFWKAIYSKFARFLWEFFFFFYIKTKKQTEKKVSSKISELSYDVTRTEIFQETCFYFSFIFSIIKYSLKRCEIKLNWFQNSDIINTINEIIVALKIYEKRKII